MSRPTFTPAQARQAATARTSGQWDHPALVAFGPLSTDCADDLREIAACVRPADTLAAHLFGLGVAMNRAQASPP